MSVEHLSTEASPGNPIMVVKRQLDVDGAPLGRGCWVWCPGCDIAHRPQVVGEDGSVPAGPCWDWDGNLEAPTFSPSYLTWWTTGPEQTEHRCHSFIRAGHWEFLGDCTHALAGQTVPMVPVPDWLLH